MKIIEPKKFNDLGLAQQVLRTVLARYNTENPYINLCVNSLNHVVDALGKPNVKCSTGYVPSDLII